MTGAPENEDLNLKQIIPGWYLVTQQQPEGSGAYLEVGRLQVVAGVGGARTETWFLYLDAMPSGGGFDGRSARFVFQAPGSPSRTNDKLGLVQSPSPLSQPTGLRSSKIVCACAAPVIVGP